MNKRMLEYLSLEKPLSPILLPIMFWLLSLISIFAGFKILGSGGPILGIMVMILGVVVARVVCESLNQLFVLQQALNKLHNTEK
jgi:hypothetical protein